jgi:hypothetical protein
MMRPAVAVVFAGLVLGGPFGAVAQEQSQAPAQAQPQQAEPQPPVPPQAVPTQPPESARFSFHRVGDSFVRLDSVTGQVAQCSQNPAGWTCAAAPEERAALENEIARLQRENAGLKKTLLARGGDVPGVTVEPRPVPPGTVPDPAPGTAKPPADLKLPSDAEIDRALAYMKNVWRKLVDMMQDLQRDIQQRKG